MIDEKTIKEAAYNYIGGEDHDKDKMELFEFMRVSFINGADWAIYEFQQRLWHDASETPTRYDTYLVRTKQGCVEFIHFANEIWHDKDTGTVDKWLDLYDILPKKVKNENTNL